MSKPTKIFLKRVNIEPCFIIGFDMIFKNLLFSQIFLSSTISFITESIIVFFEQKLKKAFEYLLDDGWNFITLV